MRTIVQLSRLSESPETGDSPILVALANDGTAWLLNKDKTWSRWDLPRLPQPFDERAEKEKGWPKPSFLMGRPNND